MKTVQSRRHAWLAAVMAGALAGCAPVDPAPPTEQSTEDCAEVAAVPAEPGSPVTALVVDNTASGLGGPLPEAIELALAAAQQEQGELVIVAVDGGTQPSGPERRVALDPRPGDDSPAAGNARAIALACVAGWAREALPVAEGSAILEALAAAAREQPTRILVVSDGLANSGEMDLSTLGFDVEPAALASALRSDDVLEPQLADRDVLWAGLGDSSLALPQAIRNSLPSLWQEVLEAAGAEVTFDTRTASGSGSPVNGLPADPVRVPEVSSVTLPCGNETVVPAALLFAPDSAVLLEGAEAELRVPAGQLADNPDWMAEVSGHTANFGTQRGRQRLSTERAEVVAAALVRLGAREEQVAARGYGATQPAQPETAGDPAAAAANRRVEILIRVPGCEQ